MKTFTGTSLLAYLGGIVVATVYGSIADAMTHMFLVEPQPDFWTRFVFCAPGDLEGLSLLLLVTLPVYGLLFRFASGGIFHSRRTAFFAGLVTSLVGCSISVYAITDATTAVMGPRHFWVHLVNMPGGIYWFPIGMTAITFFLALLIGKVFIRRAIS